MFLASVKKGLLIVIILGLKYPTVFAQMNISLGNDTTYCKDLWGEPTSFLGTNLQIENGIEPFKYTWNCIFNISTLTFRASAFLNDTTISTPQFIAYPTTLDWLEMFLTVEDSENKIAKDSIKVRFSLFGYIIADPYTINVQFGDSLQFTGESFVGGGIAPLSFTWQPENYLSNPDKLDTWCKPDISTQYDLVATDSVGCVSLPTPMYNVIVHPVSFQDAPNKNTFYCYQNGEVFCFCNPNQNMARIIVYDTKGALVFQTTSYSNQINLGPIIHRKGIYIVSLLINGTTLNGKFYKN